MHVVVLIRRSTSVARDRVVSEIGCADRARRQLPVANRAANRIFSSLQALPVRKLRDRFELAHASHRLPGRAGLKIGERQRKRWHSSLWLPGQWRPHRAPRPMLSLAQSLDQTRRGQDRRRARRLRPQAHLARPRHLPRLRRRHAAHRHRTALAPAAVSLRHLMSPLRHPYLPPDSHRRCGRSSRRHRRRYALPRSKPFFESNPRGIFSMTPRHRTH